MTLDELHALADEFFEWPDDGDRRTVSTFSALLFAKHVLEMHEMHEKSLEMHEMHEKSLGTENSAGVDALREAAQQALDYWEQVAWGDAVMVDKMDALRAALEALAGYRREVALLTGVLDKQPCDAEVALRAALEQEQEQDPFIGLELSEIDEAIDSNIKITDYRLRDGVYAAILDLELLLKEKNERR